MKRLILILVLLMPVSVVAQDAASRILNKGVEGGIVGGTLALIGAIIIVIYQFAKRAKKAAAPKVAELKKTTLPKIQKFAAKSSAAISNRAKTQEERVLEIDDEFFEAASDEIAQNAQSKGLWLKSLALADGDESKHKAIYIRLRAKQLSGMKNPDDIKWDSIDDANKNERKLELDRLETQYEQVQAVSASSLELGKRWFSFWTYLGLPFGAIVSAVYGVFAWVFEGENDTVFVIGLILFAIAGFQVSVSIGLAKRRLWGFTTNWLMVYLTCIIFFAPFIDAVVKMNDWNAADKSAEQVVTFIVGIIASAIWLVPNHIYWRKREVWFS